MSDPAEPLRHFCTYFDKNYLSRGLALYDSLRAHQPSFRLYVGCFDEETRAELTRRALPGVVAIAQSELEAHDPELAATRAGRTRVEYFFTSTPSWLRFVFDRFGEVELLTYVDADIRFFSTSEPLFAEMGTASIAAVEHRYPRHLRYLEDRGRFNVGWLSFRRDAQGLACVDWWRERCIEWCYDRVDGGRYADQKYLDEWPGRFDMLRVLQHKGVNVAPWNVAASRVEVEGSTVRVDGDPLICFHFHGLKHVAGPLYESGLRSYRVRLGPTLRRHVFEPYLRELMCHEAELTRAGVTSGHAKSQRHVASGLRRLVQRATRLVTVARLLMSGAYLLAPRLDR
jgi:hypothetical protein